MVRRKSIFGILHIIREYTEIILLAIAGLIFLRLLFTFNPFDLMLLFLLMLLLAALLVC